MSGISGVGGPGRPEFEAPVAGGPDLAAAGAATAALRFGARGEDVRPAQNGLKQLGLLQGPADGIYGRGTERAVAQFQRQHGLTPDGVLGPRTLAALEAATAAVRGPGAVADAAKALVEKLGENYGVDDPWR